MTEILNQPWEDVADDVAGAIEKAVQPLLKKAVDEIYGGLLETTQDYLTDNLAFNISSRISAAEREASNARARIERLEASHAELVAALERIATVDMGGGFLGAQACRQVASTALSNAKALEVGNA